MIAPSARILFIDGECVFCNGLVAFILKHDARREFHFSHLQGNFARTTLARHGKNVDDIDSVYVVLNAGTPNEKIFRDGAAARQIWPRIFRIAMLLYVVPMPLLDFSYRIFAKYRYKLFGKYDTCHVPTGDERARFIDLERTEEIS